MDVSVDQYIDTHTNFSKRLTEIREVFLSTELEETVKWGMPTYTINGKNVVGIGAFKAHYGVWFFKGKLLKDQHKVLSNAQKGKTQAMRQWRFTATSKIDRNLLLKYVNEAINNEKKGLKILFTKTKKSLVIPPELRSAFDTHKKLATSFGSFSTSKQREFADYITNAKRETTKTNRLEKIIPMILNEKSLNDKYRNC